MVASEPCNTEGGQRKTVVSAWLAAALVLVGATLCVAIGIQIGGRWNPKGVVQTDAHALTQPARRLELARRLASISPEYPDFGKQHLCTSDNPSDHSKQRAFVELMRHLFEAKLLPLAYFPGGPSGVSEGGNLERIALRQFYSQYGSLVKSGGACLDFSEPRYAQLFPSCDKNNSWSLNYDPGEKASLLGQKRILQGDLVSMKNEAVLLDVHRAGLRFDAILCNFVFEHVSQPFDAAKGLFNLASPGGIVFWSAPFMSRRHGKLKTTDFGSKYGDFFRYTTHGAAKLLADAGFEIITTETWGDSMQSAGYLLGFSPSDFAPAHVKDRLRIKQQSFRQAIGKDVGYSIVSAVVARRPL